MTVAPFTLVAILLMAAVTYGLRVSGLLVAGRIAPRGRVGAAFEAIPAAVLTAVIAPTALATGPAETIAAAVTALAAFRLPLLPTILIGVATVVALRFTIG